MVLIVGLIISLSGLGRNIGESRGGYIQLVMRNAIGFSTGAAGVLFIEFIF
jgi:hypothetical protein